MGALGFEQWVAIAFTLAKAIYKDRHQQRFELL
jgi:hypothetical protein